MKKIRMMKILALLLTFSCPLSAMESGNEFFGSNQDLLMAAGTPYACINTNKAREKVELRAHVLTFNPISNGCSQMDLEKQIRRLSRIKTLIEKVKLDYPEDDTILRNVNAVIKHLWTMEKTIKESVLGKEESARALDINTSLRESLAYINDQYERSELAHAWEMSSDARAYNYALTGNIHGNSYPNPYRY